MGCNLNSGEYHIPLHGAYEMDASTRLVRRNRVTADAPEGMSNNQFLAFLTVPD
jgi:hypothetical protein